METKTENPHARVDGVIERLRELESAIGLLARVQARDLLGADPTDDEIRELRKIGERYSTPPLEAA